MQRSSTLASDAFVRRSQSFQGSNLGASVRKVVRRPTVVGKGLDAQEMLCRLDEKCSDGRSCACSTSAPPTGVDGEVGAGGRSFFSLDLGKDLLLNSAEKQASPALFLTGLTPANSMRLKAGEWKATTQVLDRKRKHGGKGAGDGAGAGWNSKG